MAKHLRFIGNDGPHPFPAMARNGGHADRRLVGRIRKKVQTKLGFLDFSS